MQIKKKNTKKEKKVHRPLIYDPLSYRPLYILSINRNEWMDKVEANRIEPNGVWVIVYRALVFYFSRVCI